MTTILADYAWAAPTPFRLAYACPTRVTRASSLSNAIAQPTAPGEPGAWPSREEPGGEAVFDRVLVGLDGSPQADQVLTTTLGLFGPQCRLLVLAEVVCYEASEYDTQALLEAARRRLATAAAIARKTGVSVRFEVLAGPAGETLRRFAEEQDVDLLVVGRRGRGLSPRLLGNVSADLVRHSTVPVLVVEPALGETVSKVDHVVSVHRPPS